MKVTSGLINDVRSGYRGGMQIHYSFTCKGKKYTGETKVLISNAYQEKFRKRRFPIAFDSIDPDYNEILLLPSNFKTYDISYPDTLDWIVVLKNVSF